MKKLVLFFLLLIILFQQVIVQSGCATIIPPEGGPRDSLPPVLIKADPGDSTLNFAGKTITFTFDEYVDAENYHQELIVSPIPQNMPTVTRKLRTVTVKLRDTLEPNTTYSLNFGNTIRDVNESNILEDFSYIFSTGSYFDSLRFSGNVVLAETGGIDSTLTVMLHKTNRDSAVINEKPRYIARLDSTGRFNFNNLPQDTFYVYALKDEGGSYRYFEKTQLFAFSDSAVIIGPGTKPVTLYAYATKEEEKPTTTTTGTTGRGRGADRRLKFSTNLVGDQQDLLEKLVLKFETRLKTFDSTKVSLAKDSTYTPVSGYRWQLDSTRMQLTLDYPWQENTQHHLVLQKDFATDTLGQQLLKADTISFRTKQTRDYARLTLRFRNLDTTINPVLQFVQNNEVKRSVPLSNNSYSENLFPPGEYSLRILADQNNNGTWDPGEFFGKRRQPELVKPVHREINVRAGVDNSFEIDVTAPPRNETRTQRPAGQPGRINNPRPNTRF